ncbi:MAG: hypothetical protein IJ914_10230 [Prevotella sp.]|nr:hypothetical protein [Prevotella sp.]
MKPETIFACIPTGFPVRRTAICPLLVFSPTECYRCPSPTVMTQPRNNGTYDKVLRGCDSLA